MARKIVSWVKNGACTFTPGKESGMDKNTALYGAEKVRSQDLNGKVYVWEENIVIPTYPAGEAEKDPLFIETRAYQGSSGKVYPLPMTEKITDEKTERTYKAVWLENKYLKVLILPELGGRIQRALDKTNQYDFVYYNHVIKPALVGLAGPWISGGIEFNWPQHHRPSTFMPVDYTTKQNADGSATVFVGEVDRMYGTKGMAAITLYPDRSYIEIKGQLYNRTDTPQTFLWWANPAVPVNNRTYTIFPPDVTAVMDHGKRAVMTYPIATGEYYKYDYSEGVDISCYRNIKVPTSYMAAHSDYDFIGNFDEGKDAGLLHVADHHISPGKKQWTWGSADFGRAWDRNLTDEDGPYIELMTGVYTDNQPDFTWLKPYEEKTFTQYFMPYRHTGRVCNATKDAAVALQLEELSENGPQRDAGTEDASCVKARTQQEKLLTLRVSTTGEYPEAQAEIFIPGQTHSIQMTFDVSPDAPFETSVPVSLSGLEGVLVEIRSAEGRRLVRYEAKVRRNEPVPDPATPVPAPEDCKSAEELFLAAEHLEQYRHATREPADYYLEGLRRDPTDIRLNNGYGRLLYCRGSFQESIGFFRKAIEKETWKHPNPYYGESYFYLGLALRMCGELEEAFDAFYKSIWSAETQSAGFYQLALLSALQGEYEQALEFIDQSLIRNGHHMRARVLKAGLMRRLGRPVPEICTFLEECMRIDPLDMGIRYELAAVNGEPEAIRKFSGLMRDPVHNWLTLSLDYIRAGFYEDARRILTLAPQPGRHPMIGYCEAYMDIMEGKDIDVWRHIRQAEAASSAYCFPNRPEEIVILQKVLDFTENSGAERTLETGRAPHAAYYLGCLYYDKKQYKRASALWEKAVKEDPFFAPAFRNLSIVYYNKEERPDDALEMIRHAFELEPNHSRYLMEYDQLLEKMGADVTERLQMLEQNRDLLEERDVLYLSYVTLLNSSGRYEKALRALSEHRFHPWEGGEGKVSAQYRFAHTHLAMKEILQAENAETESNCEGSGIRTDTGYLDDAIRHLKATLEYPENLGEGKLPNVQDNTAYYFLGRAYRIKGDEEAAGHYFQMASTGLEEPGSVLYYNDQPCDTIYYQGMACRALGRERDALRWFNMLLAYGKRHIFDRAEYDYFAVSLPQIDVYKDDLKEKNDLWCTYLMALGSRGLGKTEDADCLDQEILNRQPAFQSIV